MVWTKDQFKAHTSVWGFRNNPLLLNIDTMLDIYHHGRKNDFRDIALLYDLLDTINAWLEAKADKIAAHKSNRAPGLFELQTQVHTELNRLMAKAPPIQRDHRNIQINGMCPKRKQHDPGPVRVVRVFRDNT